MNKTIRIHPMDNVCVALSELECGETVHGVTTLEKIPKGHKMALETIEEKQSIIKYGTPIGHAKKTILPGMHVHVHNVSTNLGSVIEYHYHPEFPSVQVEEPARKVHVYRRTNGDVGIRNELWIIPTVGCIVGMAKQIAKSFLDSIEPHSAFDGLQVFNHPYGCSQMGEDHKNTRASLQNISLNPNAGGVLVLGLGCENNQIAEFKRTYSYDPSRVRFLTLQDVTDEIEASKTVLHELYDRMKNDVREEANLSEIKIGLKCGGSDGLSGITANPLLGRFSDYLTYYGGTSVLTEVPEMFGAEQYLMARAENEQVFDKTVDLVNSFKSYFESHNQVIYDNPSPGNKEGGITTLEDKSLGCIQKGGASPVRDVLKNTDRLQHKGLNLISAPGNDLVSVTTLGMCGCQLVLFTTGRGTPFGGFIPTVKVSTNSEIFAKKPNWIDFNAGQLTEGKSMKELLPEFIDYIVSVIDGKRTNNEKNDFREIAIFKDGVTL